MARKTEHVTIVTEGRDNGKVFLLTEMSATQAESWAMRVFLALASSGADIPPEYLNSGMAGVAMLGLRAMAGLKWDDANPLLVEMFGCVSIIPNPAAPNIARRLVEDDIEEVLTRISLREKVLSLHVGFSLADYRSKMQQSITAPTADPELN